MRNPLHPDNLDQTTDRLIRNLGTARHVLGGSLDRQTRLKIQARANRLYTTLRNRGLTHDQVQAIR